MYYHKPVLPAEVVKYLAVTADNIYVDCTTGEGGHSEILLKTQKLKQLICIEQDKDLLKIAKKRLKPYPNVLFVNNNFTNLKNILIELKIDKVDGLLFDLGLSTFHYKESLKGFSFDQDARLDMRLNPELEIQAYDIVNDYSEKQLKELIWAYGEDRWTNQIVKNIVRERQKQEIGTTHRLRQVIERSIPRRFWQKGLNPATKTFQALRVAVNHELSNLDHVLKQSIDVLAPNGCIVVISYHSLEDRIVKNFFRLHSKGYNEDGIYSQDKAGILNVLTKKPIRPGYDEIKENRSARSAKLRAAQRCS